MFYTGFKGLKCIGTFKDILLLVPNIDITIWIIFNQFVVLFFVYHLYFEAETILDLLIAAKKECINYIKMPKSDHNIMIETMLSGRIKVKRYLILYRAKTS